jgi:hypothetical protein
MAGAQANLVSRCAVQSGYLRLLDTRSSRQRYFVLGALAPAKGDGGGVPRAGRKLHWLAYYVNPDSEKASGFVPLARCAQLTAP